MVAGETRINAKRPCYISAVPDCHTHDRNAAALMIEEESLNIEFLLLRESVGHTNTDSWPVFGN